MRRARRYGTSKAALNFVARKLRAENPGLGASLHGPGRPRGARAHGALQCASRSARARSRPI
jgi:hypothetical protein